jgi:formylmethanofuran dehydrogenase subunit E
MDMRNDKAFMARNREEEQPQKYCERCAEPLEPQEIFMTDDGEILCGACMKQLDDAALGL